MQAKGSARHVGLDAKKINNLCSLLFLKYNGFEVNYYILISNNIEQEDNK